MFKSERSIASTIAGLLLPICMGLGACGESETGSKQPNILEDRMKADADLMLDIDRAGTELERRLFEAVRAQDGIVIIHDHDPMFGQSESQVVSPNTQWVLSCGTAGISIVFGSSVTGYEGRTINDVDVRLAHNPVKESACATLGPRLGRRLNAIFREASAQ